MRQFKLIDDRGIARIAFLFALAFALVAALAIIGAARAKDIRCTFDRNELGPMGTYGQWWWDIYKCTDGTERRVLVAGPRG